MPVGGKVNYAIQLAMEYFQASGLTDQANALEILSRNISYAGGASQGLQPIFYMNMVNYDEVGYSSFAVLGVVMPYLEQNSVKWYELVSCIVESAEAAAIELAAGTIVYPQRNYEGYRYKENYFDSVGEGHWSLAQENADNWKLYA